MSKTYLNLSQCALTHAEVIDYRFSVLQQTLIPIDYLI